MCTSKLAHSRKCVDDVTLEQAVSSDCLLTAGIVILALCEMGFEKLHLAHEMNISFLRILRLLRVLRMLRLMKAWKGLNLVVTTFLRKAPPSHIRQERHFLFMHRKAPLPSRIRHCPSLSFSCRAIPQMASLLVVFLLLLAIFSLLGMQLFGGGVLSVV